MNCYVGLAKRLVKTCFPPEVPVPQLQPLDARNIIKQEVQLISTDGDAWEAALVWAEAKAQEREAAATKALSQTDTDESYDSDDSELGVSIQPAAGAAAKKPSLFADDDDDAGGGSLFGGVAALKGRKLGNLFFWIPGAAPPGPAKNRYAAWVADVMIGVRTKAAAARAVEEKRAARTIQAAARGRAVRAWHPFVSAVAVSHTAATIIQAAARGRMVRWRRHLWAWATKVLQLSKIVAVDWECIAVARAVVAMGVAGLMNTRAVGLVKAVVECDAATIIQAAARGRAVRAWNTRFTEMLALKSPVLMRHAEWMCAASPKCVMSWIKLAEQHFRQIHRV